MTQQTLTPEFLHELRTPLNHIIGYSEMLADQALEEGQSAFMPDLLKIQGAGRQMLALLAGDRAPLAFEEPILPESPAQSTTMILVVDDNPMNRDVLSRRLQHHGYGFAMAENGREALEILRSREFDMVLLDIMMPEMDGYAVLAEIKSDRKLWHVPVIMISALDELESVVRCIGLGAEDYLTKPFEPTLLRARIVAALGRKDAHDRETKLFEQLEEKHKKLQELEQLRDDLTHMIVHDLRTPLCSVITGLQMVSVTGEMNDSQKEMMDISLDGANNLLEMVNHLLDVDKMESGAMRLDCVLLDVNELLGGAIAQVAQLAEAKRLTLEIVLGDPPAIPLSLEADENTLRRVFVNLLGNAIKFTPEGGSVTIGVEEAGQAIRFSVTDTGQGIPAEAFTRIFEKFGQVHSRLESAADQEAAQPRGSMSTGLGLAFCKLAVEAHGGQIQVQSIPGEGSTFSFTLPTRQP